MSDGSSSSSQDERGAPGAATSAAAGWVPRVPAEVEAHPGQVQLMQRCLLCVVFCVLAWEDGAAVPASSFSWRLLLPPPPRTPPGGSVQRVRASLHVAFWDDLVAYT